MATWYDLNNAFLRIDAADPELERPLSVYLDTLRTPPRREAPGFNFIVERGTPKEPAHARLLYESTRLEPPSCRFSAVADRRWFVVPDRISLEYSIPERFARFCVAPGHENRIGRVAAIYALYAALFATGQALVHAAALRLPRKEGAMVLFARSGAGKTTTSLALALQGFGLMADDACVLAGANKPSGRTCVWGLPRPPKVHWRTAEMLPEIGRLLGPKWNDEGEQSLSPEELRSVMELIPGETYPLQALVMLGDRVTGAHKIRPMRKADLFVHFACDNVFRAADGMLVEDLDRYRRFAGLVSTTPAYELNVGSNLSTLGETIAAALGAADQPILSA